MASGSSGPSAVAEITMADGTPRAGPLARAPPSIPTTAWKRSSSRPPTATSTRSGRISIGTATDAIREIAYPADVYVLERAENGDFYGFLEELTTPALQLPAEAATCRDRLSRSAGRTAAGRRAAEVEPLAARALRR